MTTLVLDELKTTLEQDFTLNEDSLTGMRIKAIRPLLYLHNDPTGTFTISLKQGVTTIDSKALTMAEILSNANFSAGQYHWGVFNFEFDQYNTIKRGLTYTIELSSSGYSFTESAYVGWIKPHEDLVNTFNEVVDIFTKNPFGYQLWGHKI